MLSPDAFLNKIVSERLNKPHQHTVDIQHGLDPNKIKGIDNFPILNKTGGFASHTKAGADEMTFRPAGHASSRLASMAIRPTHRTAAPNHLGPYVNENRKIGAAPHTNTRVPTRILSNLYGLPPDRTIVLENYAAEASGLADSKHPEADFVDHRLRENAKIISNFEESAGFLDDPRVQSIITGESRKGAYTALSTEEKEEIRAEKDATRGPGRKGRAAAISTTATATAGATGYNITSAFKTENDESGSWKDVATGSEKGSPEQTEKKSVPEVVGMSEERWEEGHRKVTHLFADLLGGKTESSHIFKDDIDKINASLSNEGFETILVPKKGSYSTLKTVKARMIKAMDAKKTTDRQTAELPPPPPPAVKKGRPSKQTRFTARLDEAATSAAADVKPMAFAKSPDEL